MPQVGQKHFAYNEKGQRAASAEAKRTGKKVLMSSHKLRKGKVLQTSDGYMRIHKKL